MKGNRRIRTLRELGWSRLLEEATELADQLEEYEADGTLEPDDVRGLYRRLARLTSAAKYRAEIMDRRLKAEKAQS